MKRKMEMNVHLAFLGIECKELKLHNLMSAHMPELNVAHLNITSSHLPPLPLLPRCSRFRIRLGHQLPMGLLSKELPSANRPMLSTMALIFLCFQSEPNQIISNHIINVLPRNEIKE